MCGYVVEVGIICFQNKNITDKNNIESYHTNIKVICVLIVKRTVLLPHSEGADKKLRNNKD